VDLLDLFVFSLDKLVELSLFGLEELSTFLLLLRLPDQALRSELHLSPQGSDLLLELQSRGCELYLHVLDLCLLLGDLHFEVFPQFIVFLKQSIQFFPVYCL
jgi:hypothetical protein